MFSTSQVLIGTDSITNLHKLEQVSSDEGIGTLAENLLEALREHSDVNLKIEAARRETRAEKKRMAMAMRQKALGTLGMTVVQSFTRIYWGGKGSASSRCDFSVICDVCLCFSDQ